jgi:hypothetical protein
MPPLTTIFLEKLQDDYRKYSCFIETGTATGETTFALEPYFNEIHTIEVSETLYNKAKTLYNGNKINFILGDSAQVFPSLLPKMNNKCIFFLDGHYSSGVTGKGIKDVPLIEEITYINNLYMNEAIIIIDDFRLFGLDQSSGIIGEDWSEIKKETLLNILISRISKVYHLESQYSKDDRLIIHINAK